MSQDEASQNPTPRVGPIRRLYDWTLKWADHPLGPWALFVLAFAESSFFPIPPDVLVLALCAGAPKKAFKFAAICTAGSVLGGMAGYGIGLWGFDTIGEPIVKFYHGEAVMEKIKVWYEEYGFLGNLIAAITPIPYKVFTITSGVFEYPFVQFVIASIIGRSFRFFVEAAIFYFCGAAVKVWIERYFNWFAWGFMILLIGGFALLKLM